MKKTILSTLGLFSLIFSAPQSAHAFLPLSAISSVKIVLYGLYTTADATCKTGWVSTLKFDKNASAQDFASAGGIKLGAGSIADGTQCILMIIKNSGVFSTAAGSYTTTSNGANDNVCNSGTSNSTTIFYGGASGNATQIAAGATWPAATEAPTIDMTAAGSTQITSYTGSETGSEIVPVYLSVNSLCTGSSANDSSSCSTIDTNGGLAGSVPPTSTSDTSHGYRTVAPSADNGRYKFVVNMTNVVGNSGGNCAFAAAPMMQFVSF